MADEFPGTQPKPQQSPGALVQKAVDATSYTAGPGVRYLLEQDGGERDLVLEDF